MTAFNEVLTAEQEAENDITNAKNEMVAVLAATETELKNRLKAETTKLDQIEATALLAHKKHIADLVGKIESGVQAEVIAVRQRFVSKKSDLILSLKKHF